MSGKLWLERNSNLASSMLDIQHSYRTVGYTGEELTRTRQGGGGVLWKKSTTGGHLGPETSDTTLNWVDRRALDQPIPLHWDGDRQTCSACNPPDWLQADETPRCTPLVHDHPTPLLGSLTTPDAAVLYNYWWAGG